MAISVEDEEIGNAPLEFDEWVHVLESFGGCEELRLTVSHQDDIQEIPLFLTSLSASTLTKTIMSLHVKIDTSILAFYHLAYIPCVNYMPLCDATKFSLLTRLRLETVVRQLSATRASLGVAEESQFRLMVPLLNDIPLLRDFSSLANAFGKSLDFTIIPYGEDSLWTSINRLEHRDGQIRVYQRDPQEKWASVAEREL